MPENREIRIDVLEGMLDNILRQANMITDGEYVVSVHTEPGELVIDVAEQEAKVMTSKFSFTPYMELDEVVMEDIENQVVEEVQERYGSDKSGDDVEKLQVRVEVDVEMKTIT